MDQYTSYLDALSHSAYSPQTDVASSFLSSGSQPPSLSASPVSSEGSDSFIDDASQYASLYGYDHSSVGIYSSYDQSSANDFLAGSAPVNDHSALGTVKHRDSFGYDPQMMFDGGITSSLSTYQPSIGYALQERSPVAFGYPVHPNTVTSLANMLADSVPFTTVAPAATSGLSAEDVSAYKLSARIADLSISSPVSSPFFHAENVGCSPTLLPMSQAQPIQACDPKILDSPIIPEQSAFQVGSPVQVGGPRRTRSSTYRAPIADSDYFPSGESEVEDENDLDYGGPSSRKKNRSARVSSAAHPYLKPPKAKGDKRRGNKLEIPVPVPGLTKNSRGRSVPTKAEAEIVFETGTRTFWCSVENCDKLFSRGEHLKRHITSIHTNDRNFCCKCGHTFSRRDNLFQHMRARGCEEWYEDGVPEAPVDDDHDAEDDHDSDDDDYVDPIVATIMRDARIAQKQREDYCKRVASRS